MISGVLTMIARKKMRKKISWLGRKMTKVICSKSLRILPKIG
jgi:BRCT domain type II-containing protein